MRRIGALLIGLFLVPAAALARTSAVHVPEPGELSLMAMGLAVLGWVYHRRLRRGE